MDRGTTRGQIWADESAWTEFYPRIVAVAYRLVDCRQMGWAPRSSAFLLLVKRGCDAANTTLSSICRETPVAWNALPRQGRVAIAVKTATRAMVDHLRAQGRLK